MQINNKFSYFQEKIRRDWMFKLVGDEIFTIENLRCMVKVYIKIKFI